MKTTIDIPDDVLEDAMRFTKAKTKRDAVVSAVAYYNRRQRMAALARHLGTCGNLMTADELRRMRESE
ncbi:MAG: type II toxin-antitoxin system VapB family antitoxin [Acidobacteriota bacterium]|jgi:Arc/MetJ family transcription regulator